MVPKVFHPESSFCQLFFNVKEVPFVLVRYPICFPVRWFHGLQPAWNTVMSAKRPTDNPGQWRDYEADLIDFVSRKVHVPSGELVLVTGGTLIPVDADAKVPDPPADIRPYTAYIRKHGGPARLLVTGLDRTQLSADTLVPAT